SNRQCKRLGEKTQNLNWNEDGLYESRHARWPENVLPMITRSAHLRRHECDACQHGGNHEVGRGRRAEWHQAQKIARQNKEERRQEIWEESSVLLSQIGLRDLVSDEDDEGFHQVLKNTSRRARTPRPGSVATRKTEKEQ